MDRGSLPGGGLFKGFKSRPIREYRTVFARGPQMAWRPYKRESGGEGSDLINSLKYEQGRVDEII